MTERLSEFQVQKARLAYVDILYEKEGVKELKELTAGAENAEATLGRAGLF
jgi:hypothetical protein